MDRAQVAAFYRGKGYQVHESIVVTGQSGNSQRVPLLCEGPLGNLAVFFGDAAGIDGPEIGAAKRVARDLGATAVVAAGSFNGEQRAQAAELGVVLLDAAAMGPAPAPAIESAWPGQTPRQALERDLAAHPWPESGRPGGVDHARTAAFADIDEVAARGEAKPLVVAPATAPRATPAPAATPAASRTDDAGGLWRHPRAGQATLATDPVPARAASATAGRFAWLDLPKAAPPAAEIEVEASVSARAAPKPPTAEERAAQQRARLEREEQLRMYVRRGAWVLGGALAVYLFALWWF